jgi:hypothetical protein
MATVALAMLVLSLPAAAGAANGIGVGAGSAVSAGGIIVYGDFVLSPSRGQEGVPFTFVIPSGTSTGASLVPGVDFSKPWAAFAVGYADGFGQVVANGCSTVSNPTSWSAGQPVTNPQSGADRPIKPLSGIYFDVRCDDGSGYDFYRVQVDDHADANGPWGLGDDGISGLPVGLIGAASGPITWTWGSYKGTVTFASDNGAIESADALLFGHDASGLHLLGRDVALTRVYPVASGIVTGAG